MSAGTMHTISSHTGKEYERGLLPSAPVTTLPHPGVEVVDGREPESVRGTGLSSRPSAQSNLKYPYSRVYSRMYSLLPGNTVLYTVFSAYPHVFPT